MPVEPGYRHDFAGRAARGEVAPGAILHRQHRDPAALIRQIERHRRGTIVVHRAQPIALRARPVALRERGLGALPIGLRQLLPLAMPGPVVAPLQLSRDHEAFRDRGAALLGRSEQPRELSGNVLSFRAKGPVVGEACWYHLELRSIVALPPSIKRFQSANQAAVRPMRGVSDHHRLNIVMSHA